MAMPSCCSGDMKAGVPTIAPACVRGLAEETLAVGRGRAVRAHELEGDLAVELGIVGGEDLAHAAGADPPEDDVAADAVALAERLPGHVAEVGGEAFEVARGNRGDLL